MIVFYKTITVEKKYYPHFTAQETIPWEFKLFKFKLFSIVRCLEFSRAKILT